jgi:putative PIN family toxin of toxin-antitoxin system
VKVFVDTNVLVSAVATRGLCADVLREVLESHDLVISRQVLNEVRRVLRAKFRVSPDLVADFIGLLREDATIIRPVQLPDVSLRDRDDVPILGAAVAAKADMLITGDQELLELGKIRDVPIISPRTFWERLRAG